MGMSSGGKGGSYGMSAPGYGYGSPTALGPVPSNPALPLNGAPMGPPQFYQPSNQGLIPGLGSGPMQTPYYPSGAGYYGGDSLGTAGQLLSGGTPPSFNPAAGGNPEGIGYFGPTGGSVGKGGGTTPPPPGGSGGGKGSGGLGKGGSAALPPPTGQPSAGAAPPPSGAGVPPTAPAPTSSAGAPGFNATQLAQANG